MLIPSEGSLVKLLSGKAVWDFDPSGLSFTFQIDKKSLIDSALETLFNILLGQFQIETLEPGPEMSYS